MIVFNLWPGIAIHHLQLDPLWYGSITIRTHPTSAVMKCIEKHYFSPKPLVLFPFKEFSRWNLSWWYVSMMPVIVGWGGVTIMFWHRRVFKNIAGGSHPYGHLFLSPLNPITIFTIHYNLEVKLFEVYSTLAFGYFIFMPIEWRLVGW